ncbi:TPA: restriction endonuclease subunit S [Streptococcus suis]|nr:restriction endonuclease subunit S [Streptococcus suis]
MTPEQLKASILQRAMEGKLVPQDPNDEPASELLKRIKEEKEKLISEGKVKRDKKETEFFRGDDGKPYEKLADGTVQEVDLPYDIPESWEWVRLGAIVTAKGGKRIPKGYNLQEEDNGHPYLRVTDMKDGTIKPTNIKFAPDNVYTIIRDYTISSTDIYVTIAGTIGDVGIVPENFNNALLTENALKLMLTESINKMFLAHLLKSPLVQKQFKEVYNQVAQPKLSIRSTNSTIIPLPPLAEQKRIVAQIERALEKVEVYAESYNKLQELDKAFPDKLKKSILQYAMQGKLVAQDPNDEPVEVLLEKIRAEKQKLYEEGKLKKKDLAEIVVEKGDDNSPYKEVPYNIPKSWEWVRLGNISSLNFFSSISGDKIPNDSWVLDMEDIEKETGRLVRKNYKTGKSSYKSNKISFSKDTILYAKLRPNLKKVIISDENGFATTELLPIKVFGNISLEYIRYCMISPFYYFNIIQSVYGVKMPRVSSGFLNSTLLPLPPLTEQQRIVSKISQVFSVIESLV